MNLIFDTMVESGMNAVECFMTPISPYFICNHFISTEIHSDKPKYIFVNLDLSANDLLKNNNYDDIKNFDIIQIQVDYFDFFYEKVLPIINEKNINVIIVTSQWYLPQVQKSYKTDEILKNKNILLWMSQNPIYTDNEKYMAFPYGICHTKINDYIGFIKNCDLGKEKSVKILNQNASAHDHLPENHIRKMYSIFGTDSGPHIGYSDYLRNILDSEFVISTPGDREDCFRHYECIGLNAIPVSNITDCYKDIFGESMVYSNAEDMIQMIMDQSVHCNYSVPNRDILTVSYWVRKMNERIERLKLGGGGGGGN